MKAMDLTHAGAPLQLMELEDPHPGPGDVRLQVLACGVCRTDLHILDGELAEPKPPLIPGDALDLLDVAPKADVRTHVRPYPLEQANQALDDLRAGRLQGSAVLVP